AVSFRSEGWPKGVGKRHDEFARFMPLVAIIGPALLMLSGIGIAAPTAPDSVRAERPATAEVRPRASALLPIDRPRPRPEALLAPTQPRRTTMMLGAMLSRSERDL